MAVASINASGWTAEWSGGTPPTFDPVGDPQTISVLRAGFDATGAATTHLDTLIVTRRLRQPWPNQASWTASTVVLSDYVYTTDTIAGVTNNSTEASPKPVANWVTVDRQVVGDSLTVELIAAHRDARNRAPVACAIVTATDGVNTVSVTVSAMTISARGGDKCPVPVYAATLDLSSLATGQITVNAKVYPWVGDAGSVRDSAAGTANSREFCPQVFVHNAALAVAPPLAYVSAATGNDGTGVVSTTAGTAKAAPFATMKGALDKLRATYTYTDGCHIRIMDTVAVANPTYNPTWQSAAAVIIERDPDVPRASAVLTFGAVNINMSQTWMVVRDLTVSRAGVYGLNVATGGRLILRDVDMDNASHNSALIAANSLYMDGGVTITNPASNLLNAGSAEIRLVRGLSYGASGRSDPVEGWLVIGCAMTGINLVNGARGQSGMIVTANRFERIGSANGVFTIGASADVSGALIASNLVEWTTTSASPVYRPSADNGTGNVTHLLDWHNTFVGYANTGRSNILYNETVGTLRTHKLCSSVGSIHDQINTKHDVFCGTRGDADASDKVGGWPYMLGVGCRGVIALFEDAGSGAGGFAQEYAGARSLIGTSDTVMADVRFTDNKAVTGAGAGAGGGSYTLEPGSAAFNRVPAGAAVWPIDLAGVARRNNGSGAAGAYERTDSVDEVLDASAGALTLSGGAATMRVARRLAAEGGALALTGGAAALSVARTMAAGAGALVLSGGAAALSVSGALVLSASAGLLNLSGGAATFRRGKRLAAEAGAISLSGGIATLRLARRLSAASGALVLAGGAATLKASTADTHLLPLESVKAYLRIDGDDEDATLLDLRDAAVAWVESYTGHLLSRRQVTEQFGGFSRIALDAWTVERVDAVTYLDPAGDMQVLPSTAYRLAAIVRPAQVKAVGGVPWPATARGDDAVLVTVTAGYASPDAVPRDLRQAAMMVLAGLYAGREDGSLAEGTRKAAMDLCNRFRRWMVG